MSGISDPPEDTGAATPAHESGGSSGGPHPSTLDVLLSRYVAGTCTPAERAHVDTWIAEHPDRRAYVDSLVAIRDVTRILPERFDTGTAWTAVRRRLGAPSIAGSERSRAARAARPSLAIAATLVVALGIGLAVRSVSQRAGPASLGREYATSAGQRLSVTLVDGTQFTLAPISRLRVAAAYGRAARPRDVELEGEAYFTVLHDSTRPFAVRAHDALALDVGTAFDVRAYPEDARVRIVVADGQVVLRTRRTSYELRVRDLASVGDGHAVVAHGADVASLTAWRDGGLVFDAAPVPEVLVAIGRWYDIDLRVASPALLARHVTATFTNAPIDEVLLTVAASLDARVERRGRVVTLAPIHPTSGR